MTDTELARDYANGLRQQANQIDHNDEDDQLLDLAQLLDRLADAVADEPGASAVRIAMLDSGVRDLAGASIDVAGATSPQARQEALEFSMLGIAHLHATAAVEQARATHRLAAATEALAVREQVTHVTVNNVPADAPVPPVVTSTDEVDTETRAAVSRAARADAAGRYDREVAASSAFGSFEGERIANDVAVANAQHPEAAEAEAAARVRAEQDLALEHEHDVKQRIAATTPSAGATPDVIDPPAGAPGLVTGGKMSAASAAAAGLTSQIPADVLAATQQVAAKPRVPRTPRVQA